MHLGVSPQVSTHPYWYYPPGPYEAATPGSHEPRRNNAAGLPLVTAKVNKSGKEGREKGREEEREGGMTTHVLSAGSPVVIVLRWWNLSESGLGEFGMPPAKGDSLVFLRVKKVLIRIGCM